MKVSVMVIGAAKSGTTAISSGLALHPDICFSNPKETQFFSDTEWRFKIDSYKKFFKESNLPIYAEGSTNYTKHPHFNLDVHKDLHEYNPHLKLIYIVRNPIDRIISHYVHAYNRGYETNPNINEAIFSNPIYTDISRYYYQISKYISVFGKNQVKLVFFDDYTANPQSIFDEIFDFIDVSNITVDIKKLNENKSFNKKIIHYKYDNHKTFFDKLKKIFMIIYFNVKGSRLKSKPQLSQESREKLLEILNSDIKNLEKLTGKNLSHWITTNS